MRAIVITEPGGPEVLQIQELPAPVGGEAYPLSAVPFQEIVDKVQAGIYRAKPARVFAFEGIAEAHRVMEASQAAGKLVVCTA